MTINVHVIERYEARDKAKVLKITTIKEIGGEK